MTQRQEGITAAIGDLAGGLGLDDTPWLIKRYRESGDRAYAELVVSLNRPLAISRARRMLRSGTELEDLVQVALLGMWKAMGRFDPERGTKFSTFAVRTMDGELKRYFRDKVWQTHVARGAKQRSLRATRARRRYVEVHGTEPTLAQLAATTEMSRPELIEALEAANAYRCESLDRPVGDGTTTRGELIPDPADQVDRDMLMDAYRAMRDLPRRDRDILFQRFFEDRSQREIAEQIGCSQMHVSRLLRRALSRVRGELAATA